MKNNIKKIIPLALAVCIAVSCNKKIEEFNPGGATAESLLNTPDGFETAVNAVYTYNRSIYGKEEGYALLEAGTDIWTNAVSNGNKGTNGVIPTPPLTTYQGLLSDNVWVNSNMWVPCYAGINLANTALKEINTAGLAASRKPVLEAELRFMRAWYYYLLTETFGDVHFTLEPTESIVTTANRTPAATIYQQIIEDAKFAAANLPSTTADYGRVTKPAAEAFLARVSLTRGNNQDASNYANNVIKNYSFNLMPKYSDLWTMANEINPEVVWAVNYSSNVALNAGSNEGHSMFLMQYSDLPGMKLDVPNELPNARWMPTLFFLNLFNESDDARFGASFKQSWISNNSASIPKWSQAEVDQNAALAPLLNANKYSLNDTAVFVSKYAIDDYQQKYTTRYRYKTYDITDVYGTNGVPKDRLHYISLKKFDDPNRATANEIQSTHNVPVFRLAEMYLIAAEAQMKLTKLDSAAYFINKVRTRAAVPGHEAAMQVAPSAVTLDYVLDERAREFAGEQLRWLDLKRTGKLISRVKAYNPDAGANIKDFHVLRPIPLAQMGAVTNKGEFIQNPGY